MVVAKLIDIGCGLLQEERPQHRSGADREQTHVQVHPDQVWSMLEEARQKKCSLATVVRLRSGEAQAGVKDTSVEFWNRKYLGIYFENTKLALMGGLPHLQLVTDASTHSSKESLVSIVYSHDLNICGLAPTRLVSRCKVISPAEFDLTPEVEALAATRKVERLHAYRFLCSLSNQLVQLSCGQLSLPSYVAPMSMHLSPLQEDQRRIVHGSTVLIKNNNTGETYVQDLSQALEVPVLVVSIGQGGIGAVSGLIKKCFAICFTALVSGASIIFVSFCDVVLATCPSLRQHWPTSNIGGCLSIATVTKYTGSFGI